MFAGIGLAFYFVGHDGRLPWQPPPAHGEDWCPTHRVPLSEDEVCNPKLARGGTLIAREREPKEGECKNTLVRITFPPDVTKRAGIELHTVEAESIAETIKATAETAYVPSMYARVAPRVAGVIREVRATIGQEVEPGQALAIVESPEVAQAIAELRQAAAVVPLREKTLAQETELTEHKVGTGRDLLNATAELEEAKLALHAARQKFVTLGIDAAGVDKLLTPSEGEARVEVRAPFAGVLLEVTAVIGEIGRPETPIFAVADVSRMRVDIDVYEADLPKVEKDQRVVFTLEGLPGQRFVGKVQAIGGEVDERTRTLRVLSDVKNTQGLLRGHMFGRAEIQVKPPQPKVLVPKAAVQTDGDCWFVFTSATPNVFKSRAVELGTVYTGGYEIKGGLALGEKVVTIGSFMLKTEVLRGEMGAG